MGGAIPPYFKDLMGLITVWFPAPTKSIGYHRAIIDEIDSGFFVSLGARLNMNEAVNLAKAAIIEPEIEEDDLDISWPEPNPEEVTHIDGDKGFGNPGDLEYTIAEIRGFEKRKDLIEYMKNQGVDSLPRSLEDAKAKAIELMREKHERDSKHDNI